MTASRWGGRARALRRSAEMALLVGLAAVVGGCTGTWRAPDVAPTAMPGMTTTFVPGCPPVVVTPSYFANIDYVDFIIHDGTAFETQPVGSMTLPRSQVGAPVFRVTCNFADLNERTQSQLPPATEHSAAFLAAGTPVHAVIGWPTSCRLAAQRHGQWLVYFATVKGGQYTTYDPCGLDPDRWTTQRRS